MLDNDQIEEFEPVIKQSHRPKKHSEANTALFLGIAAIVLAAGALGLACAIFSVIAARRTINDYKENPNKFTRNSYNLAVAGIICSAVSVVLLFVFVFFLISLFNL